MVSAAGKSWLGFVSKGPALGGDAAFLGGVRSFLQQKTPAALGLLWVPAQDGEVIQNAVTAL